MSNRKKVERATRKKMVVKDLKARMTVKGGGRRASSELKIAQAQVETARNQ
jgi:hypothetical protein